MAKTSRIYAMDSLRAVMMMLGIVLHSAITFGKANYESAWPLKDPNHTSIVNDLIVFVVHAFRMQIFFIIAGFFGAMLLYERGFKPMFRNRISRIVLPFLVFLVLLFPVIMLSAGYSAVEFGDLQMGVMVNDLINSGLIFVPARTSHLWFLYYLAMFTILTMFVAELLKLKPSVTQKISRIFEYIFKRPMLRVIVWTAILTLLCVVLGMNRVETSTSLIPDLNTFLYYLLFYLFGWILYRSKSLLPLFKKQDFLWTVVGLVLSLVFVFVFKDSHYAVQAAFGAAIAWSFVFGITGLFIRYAGKKSHLARYISDASYWVYLVHLPITLYLPGLIAGWDVPALVKFFIVASVTTTICFLTYHWLVRATAIGKFLNGRKYPRRIVLPD